MDENVDQMEISVDEMKRFIDLLENLKKKFHDENCTKNEKMQILTLLPLSWSRDYIKKHFDVSVNMIKISRKLQTEMGLMSQPIFQSRGML